MSNAQLHSAVIRLAGIRSATGSASDAAPRERSSALGVMIGLNALAICSAVMIAASAGLRVDHYFAEGQPITVLSALQIVAAAGITAHIFALRRAATTHRSHRWPQGIWLLMAVGFAALACDEVFQIHERLDHSIHVVFAMPESPLTDRIDDVIVLGYGLLALGAISAARAELHLFRPALPLLATGFALFFIMVGFDLLTNSYNASTARLANAETIAALAAWGSVAEESFKLFSEAAFVAAFAAINIDVRRRATLTVSA